MSSSSSTRVGTPPIVLLPLDQIAKFSGCVPVSASVGPGDIADQVTDLATSQLSAAAASGSFSSNRPTHYSFSSPAGGVGLPEACNPSNAANPGPSTSPKSPRSSLLHKAATLLSPRSRGASRPTVPAEPAEFTPSRVRFEETAPIGKGDQKAIKSQLQSLEQFFVHRKSGNLRTLEEIVVKCYTSNVGNESLVAEALASIFKEANASKVKDVKPFLFSLFLRTDLIDFFPFLLTKMGMDGNETAKKLISYHLKQADSLAKLIDILVHYSKSNCLKETDKFKTSTTAVAPFRESSFCFQLYKHFVQHCEQENLEKNLYEPIRRQIEAMRGDEELDFCIDLDLIRSEMPSASEEEVLQTALNNIEFFKCIATKILDCLYSLNFSDPARAILIPRREHVVELIRNIPALNAQVASSSMDPSASGDVENQSYFELSRPLLGAAILLRIINPSILSLGICQEMLPKEKSLLVSLTKVIQAISNEVRFGKEKKDPVYEWLNTLYDHFLPLHRDFIDRLTTTGLM